MNMRNVKRPRRYVARHWLILLRPLTRYSGARDAYVLRFVGRSMGPVLRVDRRRQRHFDAVIRLVDRHGAGTRRIDRRRRQRFDGVERRGTGVIA
jgi:hypothetical protein